MKGAPKGEGKITNANVEATCKDEEMKRRNDVERDATAIHNTKETKKKAHTNTRRERQTYTQEECQEQKCKGKKHGPNKKEIRLK